MSLFSELKRRNVFRVGIAYLVTAWLVAQVAELAFDSFGAPDWVMKTLIFLMAIGLPFALIFDPGEMERALEISGCSGVQMKITKSLTRGDDLTESDCGPAR